MSLLGEGIELRFMLQNCACGLMFRFFLSRANTEIFHPKKPSSNHLSFVRFIQLTLDRKGVF